MRLALYQPDIPQNMGAMMRLGACFKVPIDVIEPCGFPFDEKRLRRTAMDYGEAAEIVRHRSWDAFLTAFRADNTRRLVLLTTAAEANHADFKFSPADTLLLGRESHGVPPEVHDTADACVRIPIARGLRSLNVALAAGIVLAEGLRQLGIFTGKSEL
ncbi:MAG: tRNA (cytidine(34)-2'-O)-methyltransferase [Rhodospirillaceae bacterium]|nr:tRNA (cytidine(34)-2'-O)-methyltransferase [Rhodospirillaceae bacterium]